LKMSQYPPKVGGVTHMVFLKLHLVLLQTKT